MSENNGDQNKFDALTNDVDWQLDSLHSYIERGFKVSENARARMSSSELVVQSVLDAYLHLAKKFYDQFRDELRKTYEQSLGDNPPPDRVTEADVPILMQQALNKLTAEWARAYGFIAATRAKKTSETDRIITQLSPLIRAAVQDVGFSAESLPVVPQFGTAYSLGFFNYADDFMALNLPITALQSPWEWTIFWHEIAGQKVRLLKKTNVEFQHALGEMFSEYKRYFQQYPFNMEEFRVNLREVLDVVMVLIIPFPLLNALTQQQVSDFSSALMDRVYDDFMNFMTSQDLSLTTTRKFIQDLSPAQRHLPILMFSFDDLLGEIMDELRQQQKKTVKERLRKAHTEALAIEEIRKDPKKDQIMDDLLEAWDAALSLEETLAVQKKALDEEGWSPNWLEELFEDSFSVMNFGIDFLSIFDRLLRRHTDGGKDMRHPPHHIRLVTAAALKLLECDETLTRQDQPPAPERLPAGLSDQEKEILKQFYPGTLSKDSLAVVWLIAKKTHEMHTRMRIPYDDPDGIVQKAKIAVADAMKTHIGNVDTLERIAKVARHVLASLATATPSSTLQTVQNNAERIHNPQYPEKIKTLLQSRNILGDKHPLGFRELLNLTFYDVDFLGAKITNVVLNNQVRHSEINWLWGALDPDLRNGSIGEISYVVDGDPRRTTIGTWNRVFAKLGYGL